MKVLILGSDGSMGRRYQAILGYLGVDFTAMDIQRNTAIEMSNNISNVHSHIIVTTPTYNHFVWLKIAQEKSYIGRILCEKPISKNIDEMFRISSWDLDLTMMYQYIFTDKEKSLGSHHTTYDYYNHGSDGIVWDCIQLIGIAEGPVSLREVSPIWEATINGKPIIKDSMDNAYIKFVKHWLDGTLEQSKEDILNLHVKTARLHWRKKDEKGHESFDWDPSEDK